MNKKNKTAAQVSDAGAGALASSPPVGGDRISLAGQNSSLNSFRRTTSS